MRATFFWLSLVGICLFILGVTTLSAGVEDSHTLLTWIGVSTLTAGILVYGLAIKKALAIRKARRR
ncbi:hypothetical protein SEA_APOCALYPSE_42 [Mycobacterium phage Apocalypse]|uniref:Uncharacterized protein n=1 Tax=Mycobacterium phage Apocalypse TaxID=2027890 RepID=A0A249XLQ1_9CAUD|nr:hypothetical protein I5G93_gp62 [Mycobacterium phage Apocalypse]ASZ72669.1 hypothetical protein SEA_APOCALYPSE_42 [Mycobacterium phage Apocalypse]